MNYQYLRGPLQSRRLGRSLGINVLPCKTCSFNCVYCECGPTDKLTIQRSMFVQPKKLIEELDHFLAGQPHLDHITFSGCGEPTLYLGLGEIIQFLHTHYPSYRAALLTNSSLLRLPAIWDEIQTIDLLVPTLNAVSEKAHQAINRPITGVTANQIIQSLQQFSHRFHGKIALEIFIVPGINDQDEEILKFKEILPTIRFDILHLNHLDRSASEGWVQIPTRESLEHIRYILADPRVVIVH